MPRMDPYRGVPVMTSAEFWAKMDEMDGKEPGESMAEFYTELAEENEAERKRMSDPAVELTALLSWWRWEIETPPESRNYNWLPITVLSVDDVEYNCAITVTHSRVNSTVLCSDGEIRQLVHTASSWIGTYIEPPEYDEEVEIIP